MTTSPYVSDFDPAAARKKKFDELRAGLDEGLSGVLGGVSSYNKLRAALDDENYQHGIKEAEIKLQTQIEKRRRDAEDRREGIGRNGKAGTPGGASAALPPPMGPDGPMVMDEDPTIPGARAYVRTGAVPEQSNEPKVEKARDALKKKLASEPDTGPTEGEDPALGFAFDKVRQIEEGNAPEPGPTDDERRKKALADTAEANAARAKARANPTHGGESPAAKAKREILEAKAKEEKMRATAMANNGGTMPAKAGAAAPPDAQSMIDKARELADIYAKGDVSTGIAAPVSNKTYTTEELSRAKQLANELSLGVPQAFSHSKRLNKTEFDKSYSDIVGAPESASTNEHKRARAEALLHDLEAEAGSAASAAPAASSGGDMIRVRRKSDGKTGSMPRAKFDPALYDEVGG